MTDFRPSSVWTVVDLCNLLAALERANPDYTPAYDVLRAALGVGAPPQDWRIIDLQPNDNAKRQIITRRT